MLQTFNFNGQRQIDAKANFFRYESCSANGSDESIRVRADGNDMGLFLPGDFLHLPLYASRWEVIPTTVSASGTFRLGAGDVGSSRLTGTVQIVDTSKAVTISNRGFVASMYVNPVAAQLSRAGIWIAPSASKRAIIENIDFSTNGAAESFWVGICTVQPITVDLQSVSKKTPGGPPFAVQRAFDTSVGGNITSVYNYQSIVSRSISLKTPIVVTPGCGILVVGQTPNQQLSVNIDFTEEDNS